MIYDSYKAKIEKIVKLLAVIKRYRVLILSILSTIVMSISGLVAANGTVYGDDVCPATVTYGETLKYEANAFMNAAYYEYGSQDGDDWSTTQPIAPGTYKVRAACRGSFGIVRYGKVHAYSVLPKDITVFIAETELEYGATPTVTAELAYEDYVTCGEFHYSGLAEKEVRVLPEVDEVTVYNADGEDVSHYYNVTTEEAQVTFTKRALTLKVDNATHVYDGTVFTMEEYSIENGTLAQGDTIHITFTASVINAGESLQNVPNVSIVNEQGDTVTEYYDITGDYGYLTVEKRPLFIELTGGTKVYDGKALTATGEKSADTPLAENQRIKTIELTSITNAGTADVELKSVVIVDNRNQDVTENYDVSYTENVTLTIEKRPLKLTSGSRSVVYNGSTFKWERYTVDEDSLPVPSGEEIELKYLLLVGQKHYHTVNTGCHTCVRRSTKLERCV